MTLKFIEDFIGAIIWGEKKLKSSETPNIVIHPIIYDERRLLSKVNFINLKVFKRVTGRFKNAPNMMYLGA